MNITTTDKVYLIHLEDQRAKRLLKISKKFIAANNKLPVMQRIDIENEVMAAEDDNAASFWKVYNRYGSN